MRARSWRSLLAWVAIVAAAAAVGAFASRDAPSFYARLQRPPWAPAASVFGPVWSALYLMMAVAAWRVSCATRPPRRALVLFSIQLAVNALWSWLFFAWHLGGLAFADIVVLDALVIATVRSFHRAERLAALLLVPYLAWIGFATALTWSVWQANPALLR